MVIVEADYMRSHPLTVHFSSILVTTTKFKVSNMDAHKYCKLCNSIP